MVQHDSLQEGSQGNLAKLLDKPTQHCDYLQLLYTQATPFSVPHFIWRLAKEDPPQQLDLSPILLMRELIDIPRIVTNPFHFHPHNEDLLDFGFRNMSFARWKFVALRAYLWILKYHLARSPAFTPNAKSIKE
jgi:hypothetical protein